MVLCSTDLQQRQAMNEMRFERREENCKNQGMDKQDGRGIEVSNESREASNEGYDI